MTPEEMDKLVAGVERKLGRSWAELVEWLRERNSLADLEAALQSGKLEAIAATIDAAAVGFAADVSTVYVDGGQRAAAWLDGALDRSVIRFNQQNPRAVRWAERSKYRLRGEISEEQREVIRRVVSDGVQAGRNPREVARDIRSSIGLTDSQAKHVANYRRALESGDSTSLLSSLNRELRDGRFDRAVHAAVRDEKALPPERIDRMVDAYRRNWVNYRAEVIARTEGLRAVHQGTEELYQQALESGELKLGELVRVWNTAGDARTRDSHRTMNGQTRLMGESFETRDGVRLMFPGDPGAPLAEIIQCRCSVSTRLVRVA